MGRVYTFHESPTFGLIHKALGFPLENLKNRVDLDFLKIST